MATATQTAPLRYILSKDETVQIAVPVCDALHALVWGRLGLSAHPYADVLLTEVSDPFAWVREQRVAGEVPMADRLAGLRAKWAALADAPQVERAA